MFKFRSILGVALFALLPVTAAAQEECVGIESDIARLECFDNAFLQQPTETVSDPQVIFDAFRYQATSSGPYNNDVSNRSFVFYQMRELCMFKQFDVSFVRYGNNQNAKGNINVSVSEIDLRRVEQSNKRIDGWSGGPIVEVSLPRGEVFKIGRTRIPTKGRIDYSVSDVNAAIMHLSPLGNGERTFRFLIGAEKEDREKAAELLPILVESCQHVN